MPKQINIDSPVADLHQIAAKLDTEMKKLDIHTIADLLWYFPWRYDDLSQIKEIDQLVVDEIATIRVKIDKITSRNIFRRHMTITEISTFDDSGTIKATWFNQHFVAKVLSTGDEVYLSGKVTSKNSHLTLTNPTYEKVKDNPLHSARLVPIYHLSGKLSQKQLRFLIDRALPLAPHVADPLPPELLNKEKYPWIHEALKQIHFPTDEQSLGSASDRLKFQELFYLQAKYQLAKQDYQKQPSFALEMKKNELNAAVNSLPFRLTKDQENTLAETLLDISSQQPMNRLIEGDVGSGKTVVAMMTALNVFAQGYQTAMMAPTEILAWQHWQTSLALIPHKYHSQIALLTRSQQKIAAIDVDLDELKSKIASGAIKYIIGTHSLIQDKINFAKLALVIIDEQHRFGVAQRQALKDKNSDKRVPHLLSMTATPIPRTLSLTLYGDLDISIIKEKPAGRQAVKTFLVPEKKRQDAYKFIREKIADGQQAFVICPLIDDSDVLGVKSVTKVYQKLSEEVFSDLDIRMLHGKLKPASKEAIMRDFKTNKFPILVATSVIEVGVDIPGATLMLIESAERFGLSQLHQFRGRIGRNQLPSFCMLFTTDDSQLSRQRLQAMAKTNDGFKLAEIDLELRGSGQIFGTKQTGLMPLSIAKLSDTELIKKAQHWAQEIVGNDKYLSQQTLQKTLASLKQSIHLE